MSSASEFFFCVFVGFLSVVVVVEDVEVVVAIGVVVT